MSIKNQAIFNPRVWLIKLLGTADDELWPMIQRKLDVLSKVGLSNENFTDKETENVQHTAR